MRGFKAIWVLLFLLLPICLFAQNAIPDSLSTLLDGSQKDPLATLSSIEEQDIPLALGVAEALKFRALHGDAPQSTESINVFRETLLKRLSQAKSVSMIKSSRCPNQIFACEISFADQKIIIPAHFRASIPLTITDFSPKGEAGCLFPDLWVSFATDKPPVKAKLFIDSKAVSLIQVGAKKILYRPPLAAGAMLSIGTHTATVLLADANGGQASSSWSFTIGVKAVSVPDTPQDAVVVASLTMPIGSFFPGSSDKGNLIVTVRQTPDGQRFFEYAITSNGVTHSTNSLFLLMSTWKHSGRAQGLSISPHATAMFPQTPLTYSYSYDGPGTVINSTWEFLGFVGTWTAHAPTASVVFPGRFSQAYFTLRVRIPIPDQDPPYSDQQIHVGNDVYPIIISPTPEYTQKWSVAKQGKTISTVSSNRYYQYSFSSASNYHGIFLEDQTLPVGEVGQLMVTRARWRQVGGTATPTIEFPAASQTNLIFAKPGVAELVHDVGMTLTWGNERYDWSYVVATSTLVGALSFQAQTVFKDFPPGIIGNTDRQIRVQKHEVTINGVKRIITPETGLKFNPPWVLAQAQVFPNSPPLSITQLRSAFIVKKPEAEGLPNKDDFTGVLHYDGTELPDSRIPLRMYFLAFFSKIPTRIDPDTLDYLIPCSDWLFIKTYPSIAPLVEIETDPSPLPTIREGQPLDIHGRIIPRPDCGTGEFSENENSLNLLEGYKAESLESMSWEANIATQTRRANGWKFAFTPDKGTGTYAIKTQAIINVSETTTGSKAKAVASVTNSITVKDGLRIHSPVNAFAYPTGVPIKVNVTFDNKPANWKETTLRLNGVLWNPETSDPSEFLTLDKAGNYTLSAEMKFMENGQEVVLSDLVKFSVKPVSIQLSPTRKVVSAPPKTVPLALTIKLGDVVIEKFDSEVEWATGTMNAQVKSISWKGFTGPETEASLDVKDPPLTAGATLGKEGPFTILATVTVRFWSTNSQKPYDETFSFPAVRTDLWAVKISPNAEIKGFFPDIAVVDSGRTYVATYTQFILNGNSYSWSSENGLQKKISLPPALSGVPSTIATDVYWAWSCSNGGSSTKNNFITIFDSPGITETVALSSFLRFSSADDVEILSCNFKTSTKRLSDFIKAKIYPASFSILVGKEISLSLGLGPTKENEPWFDFANGAYRAYLMDVAWKEKGSLLGLGNPFVYKGIAPASGVIDAAAEVKFVEAFDPPAKEGISSLSEGIPFSVAKEEIKIRRKGQTLPEESFSMKYKKDRATFEAIKMRGDQILGPVQVTWRLEGGEATDPLRLGILGMLGTPTLQCASLTSQTVEPTSEVEVTSYLPGSISLFAINGDKSSQAMLLIKRPVVFLTLNSVAGSGFTEKEINESFLRAKEIWGREGLIEVRRRPFQQPIENVEFPLDQDSMTTGEFLFPKYPLLKPALKNPLVLDRRINIPENKFWPVPRLSKVLLSKNRGPNKDVNVYFTERVLRNEDNVSLLPASAFTISKNEYSQPRAPISDFDQSGILIAKFENIPYPPQTLRVQDSDLAHELGHLLMEYGEEHDPHPVLQIPLEPDNLMRRLPTGDLLAAWQFFLVLDYESTKTEFFLQEISDD